MKMKIENKPNTILSFLYLFYYLILKYSLVFVVIYCRNMTWNIPNKGIFILIKLIVLFALGREEQLLNCLFDTNIREMDASEWRHVLAIPIYGINFLN